MQKVKDGRLWIILIVGVGGLCSLRAVASRRLHSSSSPLQPPKVGEVAPDFSLSDYRGKTYRLSDFRGKKVLLNFFCGCGSCAELAATWEKIHRQRGDVQVLGISTINPETIQGWRRSLNITFPALFDSNYSVAEMYASTDCPRCWVINEEGTVVYVSHHQNTPTEVARVLKRLLAASEDSLESERGGI